MDLIEMDKLYYNKFNQEVDDENAVGKLKIIFYKKMVMKIKQ